MCSADHFVLELAPKVRQLLVRNDLATTRYSEGSLHETCRDRLFVRPNYQRVNVIGPTLQRIAHRPKIGRGLQAKKVACQALITC
jgi:hypothetical protein